MGEEWKQSIKTVRIVSHLQMTGRLNTKERIKSQIYEENPNAREGTESTGRNRIEGKKRYRLEEMDQWEMIRWTKPKARAECQRRRKWKNDSRKTELNDKAEEKSEFGRGCDDPTNQDDDERTR
jgi:hypothetical protein